MYAVKFNAEGKVRDWTTVSQEYLKKYKDDPSNPLNQGYKLRETLDGVEMLKPIVKTEKETIMEALDITEDQLDKLKQL